MPDIHLLSDPLAGLDNVTVVCGTRLPEYGTWDVRAVTCTSCLAPAPRIEHGAGSARVSSPGRLTEKQWLAQVRTYARTQGWLTYHTLRSVGSEPGWVDLVCLKPPVLVLTELKTTQGRLTPHQQQWLEGLQQVTTIATHLWRPEHWDQVVQVLAGVHAPII
jgi:hypothetical protein